MSRFLLDSHRAVQLIGLLFSKRTKYRIRRFELSQSSLVDFIKSAIWSKIQKKAKRKIVNLLKIFSFWKQGFPEVFHILVQHIGGYIHKSKSGRNMWSVRSIHWTLNWIDMQALLFATWSCKCFTYRPNNCPSSKRPATLACLISLSSSFQVQFTRLISKSIFQKLRLPFEKKTKVQKFETSILSQNYLQNLEIEMRNPFETLLWFLTDGQMQHKFGMWWY